MMALVGRSHRGKETARNGDATQRIGSLPVFAERGMLQTDSFDVSVISFVCGIIRPR
jgi:hypothetical protein